MYVNINSFRTFIFFFKNRHSEI